MWVVCKPSQFLSLTVTSLPGVKAMAAAAHIPMAQRIPPGSRPCSECPQQWSSEPCSNSKALTWIPLKAFIQLDTHLPAFGFRIPLNTTSWNRQAVPLPEGCQHIPHFPELSRIPRSSDFDLAHVFHPWPRFCLTVRSDVRSNRLLGLEWPANKSKYVDRKPDRLHRKRKVQRTISALQDEVLAHKMVVFPSPGLWLHFQHHFLPLVYFWMPPWAPQQMFQEHHAYQSPHVSW